MVVKAEESEGKSRGFKTRQGPFFIQHQFGYKCDADKSTRHFCLGYSPSNSVLTETKLT